VDAMPFVDDAPAPPPDEHKADMQWMRLRSSKGWPDSTLVILLQEFIRHEKMSVALIAYMKKRGYK
jgi:hypothetical protein